MPAEMNKVAVIGSGVMGSQIAAHITNAGIPVVLLDRVPKDALDRDSLAKDALDKLRKADPSPFMQPENAASITIGNIEDDLSLIRDADWIIEVVLEDPQVKSGIYKKIDAVRKPGSIVGSSTSTIPLKTLVEGQTESFARDFMITHFFYPPRRMRLMELVAGPQTRPEAVDIIRDFCDKKLGKNVISCNDTPGFIANRLGMFWLQSAVNAALDLGLTVEEVDEVCGKPLGIPKTGVFGLLDLIGIDYRRLIGKSLAFALEPNDPFCVMYREPPLFGKMIASGYTGRKGKGGFYRYAKAEKGVIKECIDLQTGDYAPSSGQKNATVATTGGNLKTLCDAPDKIGQFTWKVVSETLSYAFQLVPATVPDIAAVDEAMRLGYNWQYGPFELLDKLGASWMMNRLLKENRPIPELLRQASDKKFYRVEGGKLQCLTVDGSCQNISCAPGVVVLSDIKRACKPVLSNASASLWDIGDGVLCLEFTSAKNRIDGDIIVMLDRVRGLFGDGRSALKGLVIHNEGPNFSTGANLDFFMESIKANKFAAIEAFVKQGQAAYHALRFAPFPSVAAPMGLNLGVGCEMTLHCSAVQACAETDMGLVGVNVGLIPGMGGCAQILGRAFDLQKRLNTAKPAINQAFETISTASLSGTAAVAKDKQYLRPSDGITINKDRLLYDAKQKVLELAKGYRAPDPWQFSLPGPTGRAALDLVIESAKQAGKASPHDLIIWKALATVLCGGEDKGPLTEKQIMDLEYREFMRLIRMPETAARIEHMLKTNKPLKN